MKDIHVELIGTGGMGKTHDFITVVALNQPVQPDVRFAYRGDKVIDAVDLSCQEHRWGYVSEFDTEVDKSP